MPWHIPVAPLGTAMAPVGTVSLAQRTCHPREATAHPSAHEEIHGWQSCQEGATRPGHVSWQLAQRHRATAQHKGLIINCLWDPPRAGTAGTHHEWHWQSWQPQPNMPQCSMARQPYHSTSHPGEWYWQSHHVPLAAMGPCPLLLWHLRSGRPRRRCGGSRRTPGSGPWCWHWHGVRARPA